MSQVPLALTHRRRPASFLRRRKTQVAVGLARWLSHLSPRFLVKLLSFIRRRARPATAVVAMSARDAVVSMSVRCAGEGCLQRSIATALLCRFEGQWPNWRAGVQLEPFRAHAWVEAEGQPIAEPGGVRDYQVTLSVPAVRHSFDEGAVMQGSEPHA